MSIETLKTLKFWLSLWVQPNHLPLFEFCWHFARFFLKFGQILRKHCRCDFRLISSWFAFKVIITLEVLFAMLIRITNLRLLPGGVLKPPPKQSDDLVVRNHFSMKWSLLYLLDYQLSFNFHKNLIRLIIQIILNKISILYHLDYSNLKRLIIWIIMNKILILYNLDHLDYKNLKRLIIQSILNKVLI